MAKLYIRIDDSPHGQLEQRALAGGLSISELIRPPPEDAAAVGGNYLYSTNDEILALIVYALIATELADRHPDTLRRGTAQGLDMLLHRGLMTAPRPLICSASPPSRSDRTGHQLMLAVARLAPSLPFHSTLNIGVSP